MIGRKAKLAVKRRPIARAALEVMIADAVRASDPHCAALVGIIIERMVPKSLSDTNWAVKGVRYGKADHGRCGAAISSFVEQAQREFELAD